MVVQPILGNREWTMVLNWLVTGTDLVMRTDLVMGLVMNWGLIVADELPDRSE
jgi:hypothetical protein